MTAPDRVHDVQLVAELNDLLQLDHDAVTAYDVAIRSVNSDTYRETLRSFRGDHERHIAELTRLIRDRDGAPVQFPHVPSGVFKLAVQQAGRLGRGDAAVILAFKTNERQSRDKYRRLAERTTDPEIAVVLGRAAADEARHYSWALETLDELGVGPNTRAARVERIVEVAHARMGDAMETVERGAMMGAESMRRAMKGREKPLLTALAAVGLGFVAARLFKEK